MKKIILTMFAVLTLLTGCNYDPNALMYGETRHIGIIKGRYTAWCKGLVYEFVFAEEPEKNKEVQMTLNVYNEPQFSSTEAPDATFRGSCILVSKIHDENYITKEKFDSYNVYDIMLDKQNSSNFKTSMLNGRVMVQILDRAISDASEYDFAGNIRPSVGSTLLFQPLDDWNEKEQRPDYPTRWRYQGDLQ